MTHEGSSLTHLLLVKSKELHFFAKFVRLLLGVVSPTVTFKKSDDVYRVATITNFAPLRIKGIENSIYHGRALNKRDYYV